MEDRSSRARPINATDAKRLLRAIDEVADESKPKPANRTKNRGNGRPDLNQIAFRVVQEATGQAPKTEPGPEKNSAAVTLGRLGGLKGGKARAEKLTPEQKKAIAKKAADARWGNKDLNTER